MARQRAHTYQQAGVDVDAASRLTTRIANLAASTRQDDVISGVGGFAGLYRLSGDASIIAASCDGVGTKLRIAFMAGRHDTVGIDLVAMNVNDLICSGATPLFFLDYFATGKLDNAVAEAVLSGITRGCQMAQCALLGGETAEMPDMYPMGEYDLAGFAVGSMKDGDRIDGNQLSAGDLVIGLASSGLHSNGYSLARSVLLTDDVDLGAKVDALGRSLADELLEPTRIYVKPVIRLREKVNVKAIVHITGGGLIDNPPRVVPGHLAWRFDPTTWRVPSIMRLIAEKGHISAQEMFRVFNMGLGLLIVISAADRDDALACLAEENATVVGSIIDRIRDPVEFSEISR